MKRIIAILAALLLALAGCGKAEKGTEKQESSTPVQSREEATQGTTEEDQAYGQRYLEPVLAGRLLWCDFGPGEMEQLTLKRQWLTGDEAALEICAQEAKEEEPSCQ